MKKKIKEICSDCYGNNPFIQNEGFESYYNMLPKDNCGKCKDTPYPNPGQGNCCEEPDHSGIYTLGCIEGYGTKCDPLRIKENCLPSGNCDCPGGEPTCTSTTCSFELPTFPPSAIYHYDLNIEDAVWTGDDATTARVVIKSGEEELLNIFYTGNFSCNDPCPNNYIQELLERVLQIYYGSIEGPTDYFTVILADNILLISSDTLKTFELSIIIGENTLDYTINNDSAFHTTTFSSEYVPAIELSESWSEFEDQYKLIWTINYTGEFQLSTTQNDITTVTHFTNISPVLSSGSCEDMTYELRHENVLIEEGEMVKTEITETKSICEELQNIREELENCNCSGEQDLTCSEEALAPICDYTVVKQEVRTGTITVELPETILCSNNQNIIIDPNGGAMYESVLYVWVKNEGDPGHTPLDSSNTKYIYRTNLSPASGPYSINREDILDNLLVSKLSTLCDIEITATGFILSNPKKGNVLGVAFNYMSGPPVNYRNGILINADIPATQEGAYYDRVFCEIKTLSDLEVFLEDEWVNVETELNDNVWERLNSFEEIKDYRLVNNSIIQEHLGEVIQSNCRSTETAYPICDFVFNAESEEITVNFTEELIYDSLEEGVGLITITGQETFGATIFGLQSIPTPSILTRTELINYIVDNFVGTSNFYIKSNTDTSITFLITYSINNFIFSLENLYLNNYNSIVFTGQNIAYEGNVTTDSYSVSFNYTQFLYIEYTRLIDNEWINFGYSGETKIIIKKFTSESELTYRKYTANQNTAEETTTEQSFVKENCLPHPYIDITYSICEKLSDHEIRITELEENGGGEVSASNGVYNDEGTIKLGGNITEDTKLDNPNSKSIQIGSDGDAMNLNVVPPFPYSGLISSYSGYDYRSAEYMSFIGVLKGLNFPDFGFINQDMVGTFTVVGNPFDSIYPDGSIMIDGVWELGGQVSMNKFVFTFLGSDITFNTISMSEIENTEEIEGDNAIQGKTIAGNNSLQIQLIEGDNGSQQSIIRGDSAHVSTVINGENGKITRSIIDSVNNANAKEEITSTSYLFTGQKVVGSDTIEASNSISPNGFVREFKNGSISSIDTLNENMYKVEAGGITLKLDSAGLNYGTFYSPFNLSGGAIKYESSGVIDTLTLKSTFLKINPTFLGFYNKEPILQPVLPLGSSTDDVIQVLQNLGLVRED
jgi:hypothetical protein